VSDVFWPSVFLVMGLLLLSLELFVPSGGFIGLSAAVSIGLGLWNAFQISARLGWFFVAVDFVAVPATAVAAFRLWVRSPLGRRFTLAPPDPDEIEVSHGDRPLAELSGQEGQALTPLHPCGHVELKGRRYDGMAESGLIPEGSRVRVVRVRSGQLVVRPVESPHASDGAPPRRPEDASPPLIDLGAGA